MKKNVFVVVETSDCDFAEPEVLGVFDTLEEAKRVLENDYGDLVQEYEEYYDEDESELNDEWFVFFNGDEYKFGTIRKCEYEIKEDK